MCVFCLFMCLKQVQWQLALHLLPNKQQGKSSFSVHCKQKYDLSTFFQYKSNNIQDQTANKNQRMEKDRKRHAAPTFLLMFKRSAAHDTIMQIATYVRLQKKLCKDQRMFCTWMTCHCLVSDMPCSMAILVAPVSMLLETHVLCQLSKCLY